MNRANNFDVLRLLAAALVVLLHLVELSRVPVFGDVLGRLPLQWGLPTFFVLSGYLVYMSWDLHPGWRAYAGRRLRRIVPAYVFVVLVCAAGGLAFTALPWQKYVSDTGLWRYLLANLSFLNFLQPQLPGLFLANPHGPAVNGALWTIKVELMFYAIVPMLAWAVRRWGASPVLGGAYLLSAVWWWGCTTLAVQRQQPIWHELARQMPGQLMYFVAGAWAWCARERLARTGAGLGWAGLAGLLWASWADGPRSLGPDLPDVLAPAALTALVVWLAVGCRQWTSLAPRHDLSYGIYLWHFPLIQLAVHLGLFGVPSGVAHPAAAWLAAGGLGVCLWGVAWLSWRAIEAPALRGVAR